jgi:hypothetical protein
VKRFFLIALFFLAGCASYSGYTLAPGQSTLADVEQTMGVPYERRAQPNGETWLYYPRQPFGRQVFVARVGADQRLIALEQRLTDEMLARIVPGTWRQEDIRNLFGPPYSVARMPIQERDVWEWYAYRHENPRWPTRLYVQFSYDGVVREVLQLADESDRPMFRGVSVGIGF